MLMCSTISLFAQERLVLTNQKIYDGTVIEQKPGAFVRFLRLPERDTFLFDMDSIERISKLAIAPSAAKADSTQPAAAPLRKFNNRKNYIFLHGSAFGSAPLALFGGGITFNRSFKDRFWIGIGGAYLFGDFYRPNADYDINAFGGYIDLRFRFSQGQKGRFATFFSLSGGGHASMADRNDDPLDNTFFISPSVAFRANITANTGLMLHLGYQYVNTAPGARGLLFRGSFFF